MSWLLAPYLASLSVADWVERTLTQRASSFFVEPGRILPDLEKDFLSGVLAKLYVNQHSPSHPINAPRRELIKLREGGLATGRYPGEQ
jgi:hypothetical protein